MIAPLILRRKALALTLTLAFLSALSTVPAASADRALVIGIDTYPELGLERPLQHARGDAQNFHDFLIESWGFNADEITLLQDEAATSDAIMTALIDKLIGETVADDRVVLYFAGLGSRVVDRAGKEPDGMTEVLLAYDAASLLGKIPEDALADILDIIADRDVTLVIDASHDGNVGIGIGTNGTVATRGVSLDGTELANRGTLRSGASDVRLESLAEAPFGSGAAERTIWTASAPGQFSWESEQGGVFTSAFIDGLANGIADANGNGTITNAELLSFVRARSDDWCKTTPDCAATRLGLAPHFAGRVQDAARPAKATPTKPKPVLPAGPTLAIDGKPVSFAETLGFVTDLFTPSNSANLSLGIAAGDMLKIGEIVSFSVTAERPGTLVLLDVNPNGELAQIFPSSLSSEDSTRMMSGQTLNIPNGLSANGKPLQIRVTEPAGDGFLLALFIEDDLPTLKAILPENLDGGPIPNAGQYLYEIAQDLLQLQANASGNSAIEWSAAYLPYKIVQ